MISLLDVSNILEIFRGEFSPLHFKATLSSKSFIIPILQILSSTDFRIKSLEAEKLHLEGWQWGKASTTEYGFGCTKGSARILNSSKIRNASAQKGYESLDALKSLIEEFPEEAKSVDLSQKDALFLNAVYYQIEEKAASDARLIRSLCKEQIKELNITI